jgi:hypothetical protein
MYVMTIFACPVIITTYVFWNVSERRLEISKVSQEIKYYPYSALTHAMDKRLVYIQMDVQ